VSLPNDAERHITEPILEEAECVLLKQRYPVQQENAIL